MDLKSKEEELLKLIRYQKLELKKISEKIKRLEERPETENTEMYLRQLIDERKINKEIYEHLKETFKKVWANRHKKWVYLKSKPYTQTIIKNKINIFKNVSHNTSIQKNNI